MLEDILEESWTYQEIIQKGMQKGIDLGLEKGLQQGLEKGWEKGREEVRRQWIREKRETLLSFVQMRFPELTLTAKQRISTINDPGALHDLIIKLFAVQTAEEARQALMEAETESK